MATVLKRLRAQILVGALLIGGAVLDHFGAIPAPTDLINNVRNLLDVYGAWLIVPLSFLEHLGGLNVYFPGSIAILLSMANAAGDPAQAWSVFLAIIGAAGVAQVANFYGGTLILRRFESVYRRSSAIPFWLMFWHPHFAAWATIQAAAQGMPFSEFVKRAWIPFLAWNGFWGMTMYSSGEMVFSGAADSFILLLVVFFLWCAWDLFDVSGKINAHSVQDSTESEEV